VTDARPTLTSDALAIVREITRRSGHEIRNALNGVAVNVEVVRSRVSREPRDTALESFAERASSEVAAASALTSGTLSLIGAILGALEAGTLTATTAGGIPALKLTVSGDRALALVSEITPLTERIGVRVEHSRKTVILSVPPEGTSHSKD
jgi:hypothetical protein